MLMIKVKYKRINSNFIMQHNPVLHLKEGFIHIERNYANMIIPGFKDYSHLFIFFFIFFYIYSNFKLSVYNFIKYFFKRITDSRQVSSNDDGYVILGTYCLADIECILYIFSTLFYKSAAMKA